MKDFVDARFFLRQAGRVAEKMGCGGGVGGVVLLGASR